jgi:hypothetical protein
MYSDNKQIRDVADVAAKIMYGQQPVTEKLHPNQQQLDVHEPEKDELTSDDFKKLRAKKEVKKEEVEELDELSKDTLGSYIKKANYAGGMADFKHGRIADRRGDSKEKTSLAATSHKRTKGISTAVDKLSKEEVESIDEKISISYKVPTDNENFGAKPGDKTRFPKSPNITRKMQLHRDVTAKAVKSIRAQGGNPANHPDIKINKEEVESIDEVKMSDLPSTKVQGRSYGASKPEPHAVDTIRGPKEKELKDIDAEKKKKKFSEMVNLYQEKGLKSLSEMLVKEEPDNEQFTQELEDAKAKSEGKKKNTEIAKGSVQAVKQEELDINAINGVQMSTIEERMMTEPEKEKKEDIVKGMKKGIAGFKDRYGSRANDVMYAAATKQAMK